MFIFIRLLLAHFIGDYVLQFNRIYAGKFKGLKGVVPHATVIAVCFIIFSWPYLKIPVLWIFILFIFVTHLLQDWIKANYIKRKGDFSTYVFDQILHIAAITVVFLTSLKTVQPPGESSGFIGSFYNNDLAMIYSIAIIVATYNGHYLISNFKKTFLASQPIREYSAFEKWYGILERAGIVSIFFLGGAYFFLLPFIIFLRPPVYNLTKESFNANIRFKSLTETALSTAVAVLSGIFLYIIKQHIS